MFTYLIIEEGPKVQILYGSNVIDESGPWASLPEAINWAESYVNAKNSGLEEPKIA